MLTAPGDIVRRARKPRAEMSLAERLLRRELRGRPDGLKFRRQHPAGRYVLDFFCAAAGFCIEVGGAGHDHGDRPMRDAGRDASLGLHDVETLRIPTAAVPADPDGTVRHIVQAAHLRLSGHHAADGLPIRAYHGVPTA